MKAEHFSSQTKAIFGTDLNLERTQRIYESLAKLSNEATELLKSGRMMEFSFATDQMRPLLSYVADNSVYISKHLEVIEEKGFASTSTSNLKVTIRTLNHNLKIIEAALASMGQVEFNPVFFISQELTHAYLDVQIPLTWEFEHDLVVCLNLDDKNLIDYLVNRGQKRIFMVGGSIDPDSFMGNYNQEIIYYKTDNCELLEDLMTAFPERPARRVTLLDVGKNKSTPEKLDNIKNLITKGNETAWLRFNTINRGDASRVLDNLYNLGKNRQSLEFHGKFFGRAAIIVCPGPSLKKNIKLLKSAGDKFLIICVLHAYKALSEEGINPHIVIHTDPQNLKELNFQRNGESISNWEEWIENSSFEDVNYFAVSCSASPEMFNIKAKNIMWMSPALSIGEFLPIDMFDYKRVGGSVSHSAFDLAVEFGCSAVALVGQDLAFAPTGELYVENAELESDDIDKKKRIQRLGDRHYVKGFNGKEVETNSSFSFFANQYTKFANDLNTQDTNIKLFNCTEGGRFIEGFEHCSLEAFISNYKEKVSTTIASIFNAIEDNFEFKATENKKLRQYIARNLILSEEIRKLIKSALSIAMKERHTNDELLKFDKIQNKSIKNMKSNPFFTLGLQREMYMLQAGIRADNSVAGQLGFHKDFLLASQRYNENFKNALVRQKQIFYRH